jgi:hypothetical protein
VSQRRKAAAERLRLEVFIAAFGNEDEAAGATDFKAMMTEKASIELSTRPRSPRRGRKGPVRGDRGRWQRSGQAGAIAASSPIFPEHRARAPPRARGIWGKVARFDENSSGSARASPALSDRRPRTVYWNLERGIEGYRSPGTRSGGMSAQLIAEIEDEPDTAPAE